MLHNMKAEGIDRIFFERSFLLVRFECAITSQTGPYKLSLWPCPNSGFGICGVMTAFDAPHHIWQ